MGLTETLKAISDQVRRKILDILKEKPLNAGEIAAMFPLTDATISHHLSVLKKAGLIDSAKNGTFIIYTLNTSLFEDVMSWMMGLKGENKL